MHAMDEFLDYALTRKYLPQWIIAAAAALLVIFGSVWWTQVYEDPYNVYWGMIANSLSTGAVTKHVAEQTGSGNLNQNTTLNFGTKNLAFGRTTLKDSTSTVTTESIGTLQNDYVRYTGIKTAEKSKSGKNLDFSSVLGKWAKADVSGANQSGQSSSAPFFSQTLLGYYGGNLVPMANLPAGSRNNLIRMLHENAVFDTSFDTVQRKLVHGRPMYTYAVSIEPVAYVAFEQAFAADMGIKSLASVDPNSYQGDGAIKVNVVIDARSHRLAKIIYPGASHTESYGSYGVPVQKSLPKTTISDARLQQLLTSLQ
jgi:hypothetical protein